MIIGLTGTIGSGKSFIASCFANYDSYVISADQIAREAVSPPSPGFQKIIEQFGPEYLGSNGELDRKKLAKTVFSDPAEKKKLESIVHPIVRAREEELIRQNRDSCEFVVFDIPLLYETGAEDLCDAVIVVTVDDETRFQRLAETRGMTRSEVTERVQTQMSQEEKVKRADFIIDNSGSMQESREQLSAIIDQIRNKNN